MDIRIEPYTKERIDDVIRFELDLRKEEAGGRRAGGKQPGRGGEGAAGGGGGIRPPDGDRRADYPACDPLEFRHPVYKRFVEIMAEHLDDKDFNTEKFFMSHPETFVSLTAASLMEERYQLSGLFKDNMPTEDETHLFKLTSHIMADYQMEVVRLEIKKTEKEIQEATSDTLASLQTRYQQLLAARSELSKTLGERVITL